MDWSVADRSFDLLSAQKEVWIADRAGTDPAALLSAQVTSLPPRVEPWLFRRCCRIAVRQIEMLRLRIADPSRQVVTSAATADPDLPLIDLTSESDPDAAAARWQETACRTPIDPTVSAPFAWALLRVAADRLLWNQVYHHAAADLTARHLVIARVAELYDALAQGLAPSEPPDIPTLAELTAQEGDYLASARYRDDEAWCLAQCRDRPDGMSLSGRSRVLGLSGRRASRRLDAARTRALRAAAGRVNVSLAQLTAAAWAALLSRLSGQADVLIGFQVAGRRPAARDVPAMLTNQIPLRLKVPADGVSADLTALAGRQCRAALRHQHYPHIHLRRALGLTPADPDPLDVGFNYLPQRAPVTIGGQALETRNLSHGPVRDLSLAVEAASDGSLLLDLDANSDRYAPREAERLVDRLLLMLVGVADAPDGLASCRIADLPIMAPAERALVTNTFSAGDPAPPATTLAAMLADRFARTPDATALEVAGASLTYAALADRSHRLARHLIARGLGPGDVVALAQPRTENLIVAVIACMIAGIAICPLDPAHPPERQGYMLAASGAKVVLCRDGAPEPADGVARLAIDGAQVRAALARRSGEPLGAAERPAPVAGDTIAYVAFTSGSTGRPKGVAVPQAAIAQQVHGLLRHLPTGVGDAVICATTLTFDVAMADLFLALTTGATLVLLREHEMRDPAAIRDAACAHVAPLLQATPSVWRSLPIEALPRTLRAVLGGEPFPLDLLERLRRLAGVFNVYGPTETTVWATLHRVDAGTGTDRPVPAGRPLAGYRMWILDAAGQPLPIEGIGELCIGGPSVTAGYLGQPALTQAAFATAPFGAGRMYRTGDLARWREDGAIELLGRRDGQVKIAGHRIELSEIEQSLLGLPWVAEAAVLAIGDPARQRLLACVVPHGSASAPDLAALRSALAARLPPWMLPTQLLALDTMPKTTSGKIDRQALKRIPPPRVSPPPRQADAVRAAASPTELLLRRAFARATGRTAVAADDDFFDIGGDSLAAMILLTDVTQAGVVMTLPLLLERRTPAAIAAALAAPCVTAPAPASGPTVFVIPGAGGDSSALAALRADCAGEMNLVLLEYPDWAAMLVPGFGMAELIRDFAGRLQALAPAGPVFLAGYSLGGVMAIATASVLREAGREVAGLLLFDLRTIGQAEPDAQDRAPVRWMVRLAEELRESGAARAIVVRVGNRLACRPRLLRRLLPLRSLWMPARWRYWLRWEVCISLRTQLAASWRKASLTTTLRLTGIGTVLFQAEEEPSAFADDPGWQHREIAFRVIEVAGDHGTVLRERGPRSLREALGPQVAALVAEARGRQSAAAARARIAEPI